MTSNNPNLDLVNMNANLFKFYKYSSLSRNKILTSVKDHKSVTDV